MKLLAFISCLLIIPASTNAFVPQLRQGTSKSSLDATAAPWFRQKLAAEYAQQKALEYYDVALEEVELVEALEEAMKVDEKEMAARSLLSYRLELESARAQQKAKAKREMAARNLLEYRLQLESAQKRTTNSLGAKVKMAKGNAAEKIRAYKVKAETTARALLSYRVNLDKIKAQERSKSRMEKSVRALLSYRLKREGESRAKLAAEKLREYKVKAEKTARALLSYRVKMEGIEAQERSKQRMEQNRRALLSYRLKREAELRSWACSECEDEDPRRMIAPWSAAEEKERAAKYAGIDCIEERAYTILKDLGMVNPALDFSI